MQVVKLKGGQRILAHESTECAGTICCIHQPSDHRMKDWSQNWRDDSKVMERTCEHGVGHPDPDHLTYKRQFLKAGEREWDSVHGCCGCCGILEGPEQG